jgi:hypothetical protein
MEQCLPQTIKHLQIVSKVRIQLCAYVHLLTYYLCHIECKSLKGSDLTPLVHIIGYAADFHDTKQKQNIPRCNKVHYFIVFQTNQLIHVETDALTNKTHLGASKLHNFT